MKKRVFGSIFLTSFVTLLLTAAMVLAAVYSGLTNDVCSRMKEECSRLSYLIDKGQLDMPELIGACSVNRLTLVAADGTVVFDNEADASKMENHAERPEISEAIKNGEGQSERQSETFGEKSFYYAKRLGDGSVLRIGATTDSALGAVFSVLPWILFLLLVILLVSALLSDCLTRVFLAPILGLDLHEPLKNKAYDELSPLLRRLERQNRQIAEQMDQLKRRQTEFGHVTAEMDEGLLMLSENGDILFANQAVRRLFPEDDVSGNYLRLCRDPDYIRAVWSALNGKSAHGKIEKDGRIYELTCSAAEGGAAALFFLDVTMREQAEQQRREFSANVSHELKTPLTSIMGYAEIIENGIVKPEDISRFAGKIYSEAKRLLTLIEDIIRLSHLDEGGGQTEMEPVDLYGVCVMVKENLIAKAGKYEVELMLEGEQTIVRGQRQTLEQMIFNLADNAIVYNNPGGNVTITVGLEDSFPFVRVKDNGIGIAPSEQSRVFERFYRVDKSHSKSTGGTGLGLSIVKHGAAIHGAKLRLQSIPGKGTQIDIVFPHKTVKRIPSD